MKKIFIICLCALVIGVASEEPIAAQCECSITPNPATVFFEDHRTVTEQFYVTPSQECEIPSYIWYDDCTLGAVDQNGLFTVPPTTISETCQVCVTDTANTYSGGTPVVCCAEVNMVEADIDADGVPDCCDNCELVPNGAYGGTCIDGYTGEPCTADDDCGPGSTCSLSQEDADDDYRGDVCDNCPNTSDSDQLDSYPPQGNGIGDACECEGNFDCDPDTDGTDAATFKLDFGRNSFLRPCIITDTCNGDFSCDGDVDGTDAALFKQDFGRSQFQNPCPACVSGVEWCQY